MKPMSDPRKILFFLLVLGLAPRGQELRCFSEYQRPDPFGGVVAPDRSGAGPEAAPATGPALRLQAARGGYVSFQLSASPSGPGPYSLRLDFAGAGNNLQADLFKAWFHRLGKSGELIPDALQPVSNPYAGAVPDPDNRVPGQTAQAFWVDLYLPLSARPGEYRGTATLESGGHRSEAVIQVTVLPASVPGTDVLLVDHNSYGTSWIADLYPKIREGAGTDFFGSDALYRLIHAYHRIFYEHRGTYHQLGYGHGGKVGPEFAPELAGTGKTRRVALWDRFDRHYAPLLDGSAFAGSRRGPAPIPFVYLTINPEWPASFLGWGEPGYEAEFTRVVGEMEKHFREKGWTRTRFEMFFNFKKRYKGFPWDGDEARFPKEDAFFLEMGRLLKKALPAETPVQFVFRNDASWRMEEQFRTLAGVVNFWICGKSILSFLPESVRAGRQRGDIIWSYSGPPSMKETSAAILENPLLAWIWGLDGYVHWQTVTPGRDPWFQSDGEAICLVYPGERFGLSEPIPSIRLKIQRNFIQDLDLLEQLGRGRPPDWIRTEVTRRINGKPASEWWTPRPPFADMPPFEWTNHSIGEGVDPSMQKYRNWPPGYWLEIRRFLYGQIEGGKQG